MPGIRFGWRVFGNDLMINLDHGMIHHLLSINFTHLEETVFILIMLLIYPNNQRRTLAAELLNN